MRPYEAIDISGDAGIRASGRDIQDLFLNTAAGMYSLITDLHGITPVRGLTVTVENPTLEGLLVSWLNELIFHFDTYGFIGREITFSGFILPADRPGTITASLSGEEFDTERHERRLLLKAATYHKLRIEKDGDRWVAEVIFDI